MSLTDEWITASHRFASQLASHAERLQALEDAAVPALQAEGTALLQTLLSGLGLLPECESLHAAESLAAPAMQIDAGTAEQLAPLLDLSNQLAALGASSRGPAIWAQERDTLPDALRRVPLPDKHRRVVDNILWTRDMFESSTRALEGVSEEIERQDGSGVRKAKAAAREIEEHANNPPVKPSLFERIGKALYALADAIFG
ncbi:hypothetical protein [Pseudomaricurvus sp. HS19]|uniref:hypothetical protein n=1 Tax=Pseudomaricurvus sp. HS19 TaxID=2692626 RepID=UPI0013681281|nr:hypothetical protein [Pseudomaricurvus sp. HS19]MYM63430.1 hypothetical protein [Pseudomaricurvus sp. HS19]